MTPVCPLAPALPTVLQGPRPRARQVWGSRQPSLPTHSLLGFSYGDGDLMLKVFFYLLLMALRDGLGVAKGGGALALRL